MNRIMNLHAQCGRPPGLKSLGGLLFILFTTLFALLISTTAQGQNRAPGEEEDLLDYTRLPFRLSASTGFDYSEGDYGTGDSSSTLYIPTSLKLELDPLIFRVSIPWVRSTCNLFDDACQGGAQPEESGVGDVVLGVAYVFYPEASSALPAVELSTKVKIGTGDPGKGLGTGENDYTLQADFSKAFGSLIPFAGLGYRFVGDPPGQDLRDKWLAYAGVSASLGRRISVGFSYDWSQSASRTRPDSHELSPFASFKFGRSFAINPYAVIGLSENSPDWGLGVQFRVSYDRF
jgi:hypothetical protein